MGPVELGGLSSGCSDALGRGSDAGVRQDFGRGRRMNVAGRPVLIATYFPLSWSGEAFIPAMPSVRN